MAKKPKCRWSQLEGGEYWDTQCGKMWMFLEGGPKDNKFKFCPYCSKPIQEAD